MLFVSPIINHPNEVKQISIFEFNKNRNFPSICHSSSIRVGDWIWISNLNSNTMKFNGSCKLTESWELRTRFKNHPWGLETSWWAQATKGYFEFYSIVKQIIWRLWFLKVLWNRYSQCMYLKFRKMI